MIWTTKQINQALSLNMTGDRNFGAVQFNSNDIQTGDIFIALQGNRDGHEFVKDALNNGASVAIVSKNIEEIDPNLLIIVEDTYQALIKLAEYKRHNVTAKFIGLTGSVGKTTTKSALKMMLDSYGKTYASHGTFNNHLGVPLTLASIPDDAEYVIIEMGMNSKNELSFLSKLAKPDIALVTTISEGHIEFFDSIEDIADAKCEIFEGLDNDHGIAIINHDIEMYDRCIKKINQLSIKNIITFGENENADINILSNEILEDENLRLKYLINNEEIDIVVPSVPPYFAYNFAASFAVINALGCDIENAASAICSFAPGVGRGKIIQVNSGQKEFRIICDYYNANPQSMASALQYLGQFNIIDKVAILGNMGELGKLKYDLHKDLIVLIKEARIKKLFLVGELMNHIKDEFDSSIQVISFADSDEAAQKIDQYLNGGEMILIKGSRSMKLEKIAQKLGVSDAF
ncbi:MAG: UDP-N-acetylmuramoyl-tripeptide--D-alanyl-D-alanine ligase [Rickettsiales bacterium]|nr:MAG: UDP-N-acetylmuramoyl-tripeptide--D-alanyl-D-alanine ligase [Rickettsiales bacterium]